MSNSSGTLVESAECMPFGPMRAHTGTTVSNYKYTDQELDPETGLYYYGARYYDPIIGRFISPDSIVQNPANPQTLNRYSYCANNPLIYTDPSGYGFFGIDTIIGAIIGAVVSGRQSGWNPKDMLVGAVIGGISGGIFSEFSTAVNGAIGSSVTNATIAGTISGGAGGMAAGATAGGLSAAYYGGDIGQGVAKGAGIGAVGGAAFGAIGGHFGKTWDLSRVGAYSLAGGGVSALAGQGFEKGAIFAGLTAFARYTYNEIVGFDADWRPGGEAQEKLRFTMPYEGANNIGTQDWPVNTNGWFNEGGIISRALNYVPGLNATAGLHDVFQIRIDEYFGGQELGGSLRSALNVPGMLPAAALSYGALMSDPRAMILYSSGRNRE
jgi:RHS repeat-associated protein